MATTAKPQIILNAPGRPETSGSFKLVKDIILCWHTAGFKICVWKGQDFGYFELSLMYWPTGASPVFTVCHKVISLLSISVYYQRWHIVKLDWPLCIGQCCLD